MSIPEILLGQKVRDKVTGYEGIAMNRVVLQTAVDRIGIQPPVGADGKVPDELTFDITQLEVVDTKRVVEFEMPDIKAKLGDLMEDTLSGFRGRVVGHAIFLNGCARVTLQPPVVKEGKLPDMKSFDYLQLKKIEDPKPVEVQERKTKTGGPSQVLISRPTAKR